MLCKRIERLGDELRFASITSDARVLPKREQNGQVRETEIERLAVQVD